jgi:hypothetical protein
MLIRFVAKSDRLIYFQGMEMRGFPASLPEFQRVFPDDAACAAYLEHLRWPAGFVCAHCGHQEVVPQQTGACSDGRHGRSAPKANPGGDTVSQRPRICRFGERALWNLVAHPGR